MEFSALRKNMVDGQLRPNKITDKAILQRFLDVPREFFVDTANKNVAYSDGLTPLGGNRFMFSPLICATMLQSLDLQSTDSVLVVASGTGYTATLISTLVSHVYAIEENPNLHDIARKSFYDSGCSSVLEVLSSPEDGYKSKAPYDKIFINAAVEEVPDDIVKQLKNGGKLVAVVKKDCCDLCEVTLFNKVGNTFFEEYITETNSNILPNFTKEEKFEF